MRSPEVTHRIMSAIKSKNTEPEMMLRKALWNHGARFRVNYKKVSGKPDLAFTKVKLAIFCDGDFWHGHNWALRGIPCLDDELASYSDYWKEKILKNIERDKRNTNALEQQGWTVIRLWESDVRSHLDECVNRILEQYKVLKSGKQASSHVDR